MQDTEVHTKSAKKYVPVSLSAEFGKTVQEAAANEHRSLAQQLEFWALLGQKLASVFPTASLAQLKSAADPALVIEALNQLVLINGSTKVQAHLKTLAEPLYEAHPDRDDWVVAVYPDGSRTVGAVDASGVFAPLPATVADAFVPAAADRFKLSNPGVCDAAETQKSSARTTKVDTARGGGKAKFGGKAASGAFASG